MNTWLNVNVPVEERISDLLAQMTLREKVGQLHQRIYGWHAYHRSGDSIALTDIFKDEVTRGEGMGGLYGLFRADPWSQVRLDTGITPELSAKAANAVQRYVLENTRLGIPVLLSEECPHGHQALGATLLPTNIGVGCSWNPALLTTAASCVAASIRARGAHLGLVSALDLLRDPRWGRAEECFSEDPILASRMAEAATRGLQGETLAELSHPDKIVAVLKHCCAQGGCVGGHNAGAAPIGPRELHEIFLPPVQAGVAAGAQSFMAAYNEIDGIPCHANKWLLTSKMREEWGFAGVVMSDGNGIDSLLQFEPDALTASVELSKVAAQAIIAGVDFGLWGDAFAALEIAVNNGSCPIEVIDGAVARVLRLKFLLGLFENPFVDEERAVNVVGSIPERESSLQLARETLVLLRNEDAALPLSPTLQRIAIIGPNADNLYNQLGDYTAPQLPDAGVTVLQGIQALMPQAEISYAAGCGIRDMDRSGIPAAVAAAAAAEVAVVVLGGSSKRNFDTLFEDNGAVAQSSESDEMDCGEGVDVADLCLGGVQEELLQAVLATGTPTVVVLIQGRPHSIPWLAEHCPAVLCAWYPGLYGGTAVAEALFGVINPSGRLSVSIPRSSAQLPVYYNHKTKGDSRYRDMEGTALYPFGYGLSYTSFTFANLQIDTTATVGAIEAGASIAVAVDVTNSGACAGAEVVQLYIHGCESSITRRIKELKAFDKVMLQPGETRTVHFSLDKAALGVWNPAMQFVVESGRVEVLLGGGCGTALTGAVTLIP